mmetsp:Transcript_24806/g.34573  ORF Transcript_24806/g.34573 Transcript_24806/m.34573 type:complete len:132 (-) Transcript_24806:161-556(-)
MPSELARFVGPIAYGATAWALGVVFVRVVKEHFFLDTSPDSAQTLMNALLIPGGYALTKGLQICMQGVNDDLYESTLLSHAAAASIDGIVIAFYPWIYGTEKKGTTKVSAGLLWGLGAGMFASILIQTKKL